MRSNCVLTVKLVHPHPAFRGGVDCPAGPHPGSPGHPWAAPLKHVGRLIGKTFLKRGASTRGTQRLACLGRPGGPALWELSNTPDDVLLSISNWLAILKPHLCMRSL